MKILNLSLIVSLCAGIINAQIYENNNEVNPIEEYIKTLEPVLNLNTVIDPFNIVAAATAKTSINETLASYEELYNKSTDECLRSCYSYSIHLLEISYHLNCESKFSKINAEYNGNKPCYKANPDMQNILDNGNAYLDLFCSRDESNEPCSFVTDIVKIPDNSTILESVCKTPEDKRKKCDKTLINSLSVMIDSNNKLGKTTEVTYSSGGKTITLNTPTYDLAKIETQLNENKCLAKVEAPTKILVNADDKGSKDKNNTKTSDAFITAGQGMNTFMILITFSLIALLF